MPTQFDAQELNAAITALRNAAQQAIQNKSSDDFELVERRINEFAGTLREFEQSLWEREAKTAIRRLESGEALTEEDQQVIRTFLVADAEQYLALENNFQDWVRDLNRLFDEIQGKLNLLERDSIGRLRGVLKDAVRLAPDIRNYLDEHRRIELFDRGLANLDDQTRATLARLLKEQLRSAGI